MKFSLVPKLLLLGLLVLTLSLKVRDAGRPTPAAPDETMRTYIAAFLAQQGFKPDFDHTDDSPIAVTGHSGGCTLWIANVAPEGWHQYIPRRLATAGDQVFFFFRGRKYDDQPVWQTRLSGYGARILRKLGFSPRTEPVMGIIASQACDIGKMPWQDLASRVATVPARSS